MKTVLISKFIWQRVPDCRASVIQSPTAVRVKISRQRGTVRRFRLVDRIDEDGEEQHQTRAFRGCFKVIVNFVIFPILPRSLPRTNLLEIWYRGRHADAINCVAKLGVILQSLNSGISILWFLKFSLSRISIDDLGCRVLRDSAHLWYSYSPIDKHDERFL